MERNRQAMPDVEAGIRDFRQQLRTGVGKIRMDVPSSPRTARMITGQYALGNSGELMTELGELEGQTRRSPMILEGKTLIICGVGTGLGSEIARAAHRDSANLVLAARTQATLEAAAKEIDPSGERVEIVPTDITDEDQCQALAAAASRRFGHVDAMAQVAAVDTVFGGLSEVTAEDLTRCMNTNLIGSVLVSRAVAEHWPLSAQKSKLPMR